MGVTTQKANYLTEWNKSKEEGEKKSRFLRLESLFLNMALALKELAYTGLAEKCFLHRLSLF